MTGNVIYAGMKVSYLEYSYLGIMIYLVLGQMSQTIYRTTIDKKYGLLALKLLSGIKPLLCNRYEYLCYAWFISSNVCINYFS